MSDNNTDVICKRCRHCRELIPAGRNKYDIECDHNPNLGGVGKTYGICPGFCEI